MSFDRDGLEERLDDLYVRYFMPPSVTADADDAGVASARSAGDGDVEPFDFDAWLREGRGTGPTTPPAEPRVVTGATAVTEPAPADVESFDFVGWLSDGESFRPVEAPERDAGLDSEVDVDVAPGTNRPHLPRPSLHPAKAATFALFLSVVALVGLTVVGSLPALGPATGLGP